MLYLPAYSPDLNPIEMAFSKLKAHLRARNARTIDELWQRHRRHLPTSSSQTNAENFFKAAGYGLRLNVRCSSLRRK